MHCRVSTMDIGLTEYRTLQNRMRAGKATARTCIIVSLIARGIVTYNLAKNCWGGDRSTASCLLWPLLQTLSLTKMEKSAKQGLFLSHTCGQGRECTSIFSPSLLAYNGMVSILTKNTERTQNTWFFSVSSSRGSKSTIS
jgi:hypothetical protein